MLEKRLALILSLVMLVAYGKSQERASWMKEARLGIMTHYLADWQAKTANIKMDIVEWNKLVDNFDVEGLADQVKSTGAGYMIFTIGQNSGYYVSPNATYDSLTGISPGKCSKRDLIADLATALKKRHIRLIVYLPSGAPVGDEEAKKH